MEAVMKEFVQMLVIAAQTLAWRRKVDRVSRRSVQIVGNKELIRDVKTLMIVGVTEISDSVNLFMRTNRQRNRIGDEERRLMHLVPAPAVRLMKRRVLSTPGLNSLMS